MKQGSVTIVTGCFLDLGCGGVLKASRRLDERFNHPAKIEEKEDEAVELLRRIVALAGDSSGNEGSAMGRSGRQARGALALVRSGVERILGFPSKSAYFAFWKKLFIFDLVSNVARVGGTLFLYLFAPNLYKLLPPAIVG